MNNANLESFTDILGDEIADSQESQPFSISSGNSVEALDRNKCDAPVDSRNATQNIKRPAKGTGQYGQFRSVDEIEEKYRHVFSYPFFNIVQSSVIDDALYSDKSMVVCAPTGSGKTVVFEMAIVQLLMELEDTKCTDDFKIIYMAPVKALCTERLTEWYPKFTKLGLMCIEVTGDTDVDFSQLKPYRIIITTPEKWDMITRRWREHRQLVEVIKLFLIDEVHILNDETRGPVLEAVVSRMKTIEASAQSAHRIEQLQKQYQNPDTEPPQLGPIKPDANPPKIRFVAVSATVGNPGDVAAWLGNTEKPAVYYKFGDESRPVKLKRVVEGYPCPDGTSIFKFDIILNYKLWPVIQKYHNGKPTLIFCNTRKSVALTAEALSREITVSFSPEQKAKLTALASTIKNKKLQILVLSGVGCHHAGLLYEERNNIENAFRNRDLPILITTTTLAMGVNLPAHLVIIKNTQQYVNGAYQEYSISTVLQMVGRAGRPQYDTEATAVIMTRLQDKPRYQALVGGSEPLQSYLHKRLAENLNSEAALGTVNDVAQCVQWLRSTFLCVRAARDPKRYLGLPQVAPQQQISKKIEELCVKAMNGLATAGLITMDEASCIESTEAGRLMSVFYLDLETMKHIMKVNGSETLERLLWVICESHELADMHLRVDERRTLNLLNRNNAAATIRFPMKGKISTRQMKLNCMIQAILGCLNIPDPSLNQEAMKIMRTADRVCKCLVAYLTRPALISTQPPYYNTVLNALILAKCISAHLWENSPYVSKQLRGIGPTFSTLLATAGKVNFMLLEESHPRDLERIMNKGPPAGNVLRKQVSLLPKYQLTMAPIDEKSVSVQLVLLNQNHLSENMEQLTAGDTHKSYMVVGDSENNLLLFISFKDKDLIGVFDGGITHQITRKLNFEHKMFAYCISSSFVGIDAQSEYTFKDLEAVYPLPPLAMSEDFAIKKTYIKQTTITDTFKERKRKSTSDNDVSQSKEKKKRDNALLEKFKCLKESFGKTTKEIKDDLGKTAMMSNKILQDLGQLKKCAELLPKKKFDDIESEVQINCGPHQDISANTELIHDDDFIDDDKINKILKEIDDEISRGYNSDLPAVNLSYNKISQDTQKAVVKSNQVSSVVFEDKTNTYNGKTYGSHANTNIHASKTPSTKTYKAPFNNPQKPLQKNTKSRTKFNFVDLLAKNTNLNDDNDEHVENANTGFSDAIKSQIQKYLQKTKENIPDKVLQVTELIEINDKYEQQDNKDTSSTPVLEKFNTPENYHKEMQADNHFEHDPKQFYSNISVPEGQENPIESRANHAKHICDTNIEVEITHCNKSQQNDVCGRNYYSQPEKNIFPHIDSEELNGIHQNTPYNIGNTPDDNNLAMIEEMDQREASNVNEQCGVQYVKNHNPSTRYIVTDILEPVRDNIQSKTDTTLIPQTDSIQYLNPRIMSQRNNIHQLQNTKEALVLYKSNEIQQTSNDGTRPTKVVLLSENLIQNKGIFSTAIRLSTSTSQMQMAPNNIFSNNKQIQKTTCPRNSVCPIREMTNKEITHNQIDLIPANSSSTYYVQNNSESIISQCTISNQYKNKENSDYKHNCNSDSNQYDPNANIRNYAYSATKIDVATRNNDTTVIRKIQMDLNITEIIAQRRGMNRNTDQQQRVENSENTFEMFSSNILNKKILPSTSKCFTSKGTLQNHNLISKTDLGSQKIILKYDELAMRKKHDEKPGDTDGINNCMENREIKCKEIQKGLTQVKNRYNRRNEDTNSLTLCTQQMEQTNNNVGTTTHSNHDKSDYKSETTQKEGRKIENILQKYSKILNKDKTEHHSQKPSQCQPKIATNFTNITQPEKPKRPFKISEIQNMNSPLPELIIMPFNQEEYNSNEKKTQNDGEGYNINISQQEEPTKYKSPLPPNIQPDYKTEDAIAQEIERNVQAQNLADIQKIASNIEEDLSKFCLNDTLIEQLDSKEFSVGFNIDNSMFNPKTLLQCYNNDESDVYVPPPPEFCDESQLAPEEQLVEDPIPIDCYEPMEWENTQDDVSQQNIFRNDSLTELTPRKEIETWTFSQHDESYQNLSTSAGYNNNSRQPFTIMHTPRLHNRPFQNVSVSRQNRLSQFKFPQKKRLPKP